MNRPYHGRQEHLDWAKERALAYLDAVPPDVVNATASFVSDLGKHEELADHLVKELIAQYMWSGLLNERSCRDLITGTR